MRPQDYIVTIPAVFALAGVVITIWLIVRTGSFYRRSLRAPCEIMSRTLNHQASGSGDSRRGGPSVTITFRFTPEQGKPIHFEESFGDSGERRLANRILMARYLPEDPAGTARVEEGAERWLFSWCVGVPTLILIIWIIKTLLEPTK